jgi:tetratricopeptide (TPR) repeat protein
MEPQSSQHAQGILRDAVARHQQGKLSDAEHLCREGLRLDPESADAWNFLGVLLHQTGRPTESISCISRALELEPDNAGYLFNLGATYQAQSRLELARDCFLRVLSLNPDWPSGNAHLGDVFRELGDKTRAMAAYQTALELDPHDIDTLYNLAGLFHDQGRLDDACQIYGRAIALAPNFAEAHNNQGLVYTDMGERASARDAFMRAIDHNPAFPIAHRNLAFVLNAMGQREEALSHFKKSTELARGPNAVEPQSLEFRFVSRPKLNHDIEQFDYLARATGQSKFMQLARDYEQVRTEIDWSKQTEFLVELSQSHRALIGSSYNRVIHLEEANEVPGTALNPELDVDAITRDYLNTLPGAIFVDDFLQPTALASLRRFLLGSTIWSEIDHDNGYLGVAMGEGIECPLLLQIADELRARLPQIFADHALHQLWAYKYDSRLSGIDVHADFAAVNVNFWVTPDEANLDPDGGGLVVYKFEAPKEWSFSEYNIPDEGLKMRLDETGHDALRVPHRQNRAVIFDSDLFHATGKLCFKPGYENRRINITMLFGNRKGWADTHRC